MTSLCAGYSPPSHDRGSLKSNRKRRKESKDLGVELHTNVALMFGSLVKNSRYFFFVAGYYVRQASSIGLAGLLVYLSIPVVQNLLSSRQMMNTSFDSLRIVNTYGAFGRYM